MLIMKHLNILDVRRYW